MRRSLAICLFALSVSCSLPSVVATLDDESPSPALGRPGWVSGPANVGAWVGGAIGAVASVLALPITWPIAQLADEQLGFDQEEFTWAPVSVGAGTGHFLLGAPFDGFDYLFRRAWIGQPGGGRFEVQPAPVGPPAMPTAPGGGSGSAGSTPEPGS